MTYIINRNIHIGFFRRVFLKVLPGLLAMVSVALSVSCSKIERHNRNSINVRVTAADTKGTVTTTDGLKASGAFSMMAYLSDDYVMREEPGNPRSPYYMNGDEPALFGEEDGLYFPISPASADGNVTLSGSSWSISGDPKWVADVDTYFWAWHPVTAPGRSNITPVRATSAYPTDPEAPRHPYTGELTFSYVTPTPAAGQGDADAAVDLLFAYSMKKYVEKPNMTDSDKSINITFHHALSQVRFCVSTDDGTFDKSLKIKSISISNLKTSGNATFSDSGNAENNKYAYAPANGSYDKFEWKDQSGSKTFTQTYDADFSTSTVTGWTKGSYTKDSHSYTLYTCENVFFMIPQAVTEAGNSMTVKFDYKGAEIVKTVPITDSDGDTWLGDHYYTYKINATTLGRDIDLSVSLVGWSNRKEEIFI